MVRLGRLGEVRLGTVTYDFPHLNRGQEEEDEEETTKLAKISEIF